MGSLVLHIGYPKTGTTTLQHRVFQHLAGSAVPGRDDDIIRPFFRWSAHGSRARVSAPDLRAAIEWLSATRSHARILSEESILGLTVKRLRRPQQFRGRSPALNLVQALERLEVPRSTVHVVLTVRPQADLLPSAFAEAPPSSDLGRWIGSILALPTGTEENPFDFNAVAASFSDAFGRSNVHVLPLHRIGKRDYFEELCRGTGLKPRVMMQLWSDRGGVENARRQSVSTWEANEPMRLRGRLAVEFKEFPRLRKFLVSQWNLPVIALSALSWRPVPLVTISDSQRGAIVARFAESNRKLSRRFGLDLDGAGYW